MTALPVESGQDLSRGRIRALDGMRGLAALGVMLLHFSIQLRPEHAPLKVLKLILGTGPRLELFFILSGFFVTGLLYEAKRRPHYFRSFYARRMLRILPLYYGALTVLFVMPHLVSAPGAASFQVPLDDQLWYWFYLQNFRPLPPLFIGLAWHFWSLAIEQQFYLVWPIVILKTSRESALRICGALIAVSISYRIFGDFDGVGRGTIWPTPARLDGIAVGSAIALIMRGPRGLEPLRRRLLPIFLLSVAYIAMFTVMGHLRLDRHTVFPIYFTSTALFFGCLLIYAVYVGDGPAGSMLRSRALAFFGKYGYGLYVFHVPLIPIVSLVGFTPGNLARVGSELGGALIYIAVMIALTTAVALLSWHLWEKQFLKLRPVLMKRRVPQAERTAPAVAERV